jgi:hypothetical protein
MRKLDYLVFFHNDRGSSDYEFMSKADLKGINYPYEYVSIYKVGNALTAKDKEKLGLRSINDRPIN